MTIEVSDDQIFDSRNDPHDHISDRDQGRKIAAECGYKFIAWNGAIHVTETDDPVFCPPDGFLPRSVLPFIGWKDGYSYKGTNRWLLGEKNVGFAVIPLTRK